MGKETGISWTDATANLWWGCERVSPGCDHCYAELLARRWGFDVWGTHKPRRMMPNVWKLFANLQRKASIEGRRMRVFVQSMSDICEILPASHPQRAEIDEARRRFFEEVVPASPDLDFLLLTKRVGNFAKVVPVSWMAGEWPENAWAMITVVNQVEADRDIPKLLSLPAKVRGLSIEPMLGPIDLNPWLWEACSECEGSGHVRLHTWGTLDGSAGDVDECGACEGGLSDDPREDGIHWVIVGGESGPKSRAINAGWVRDLRDHCALAGVAFHHKQWGEYLPDSQNPEIENRESYSRHYSGGIRVGTKRAGRMLDGVIHDAFPEVAHVR